MRSNLPLFFNSSMVERLAVNGLVVGWNGACNLLQGTMNVLSIIKIWSGLDKFILFSFLSFVRSWLPGNYFPSNFCRSTFFPFSSCLFCLAFTSFKVSSLITTFCRHCFPVGHPLLHINTELRVG